MKRIAKKLSFFMAPDESYMSSEVLELEASVNSTFESKLGAVMGK